MSQDDTERLRQKLNTWWNATTAVFEPSVAAVEGQTTHAKPKFKNEDQHERNGKTAARRGYSGHWNILAFGTGLFGGGIFGASFNFYTAKDFQTFWALFDVGTALVLFAIIAFTVHAWREQVERNSAQELIERNARIDSVVSDFRVLHKETEYRERINSETHLLMQCSPFRLKNNSELREACQKMAAFKLPNPIKCFEDDPDPMAFLRYCDKEEIIPSESILNTYYEYRGFFGWKA